MKTNIFSILLIFLIPNYSIGQTLSPVDYVNPLMGSDSNFSLSNGNTYPAIAMPWGMNFWTPQTAKMGDGWVYAYDATKIQGFKQNASAKSVDQRLRPVFTIPRDGGAENFRRKTGKLVFTQSRNRKTILLQCLPGRLRCNNRNYTYRTGCDVPLHFS